MPPGKRGKNAGASGSEGIEALPDEALAHILGFLPATDAVRTCVLARRWRHIWKSATGLHVRCCPHDLDGSADLNEIIEKKERISQVEPEDRRSHMEYLSMGTCGVLADSLVSRYLTRLEVTGMEFLVDFSGCPSLEHLDIFRCDLSTFGNIESESLKRLSITNCYWRNTTTLVCVPNLVSLRLDYVFGMAIIVLKSMPLLQEAFVRIGNPARGLYDSDSEDSDTYCGLNISMFGLLSLSEARNLALTSGPEMFILNKGLELCPTFSKLKSLLLNESWCVAPHLDALACILEHSPILQTLCLHLFSEVT